MGKVKRMKHMPLRGLSIQQRLPLLICVLLLGVMVTFSWISYLEVKQAAIKTGTERLRSLNEQLSSMFSQSIQATLSATRQAAANEFIRTSLRTSDPQALKEASDALQKIRQDTSSVLVDLLDLDGHPVIRSGKDSIHNRVDFNLMYNSIRLDTGRVGNIIHLRDSMYYPFIMGVIDNNKVTGYIVRWRILNASAKSLQRLSDLLGVKATIYIGNKDQSLWTDMIKVVSAPIPANTDNSADIINYSADGNKIIAAKKSIQSTPWLLLMAAPQSTMMGPANSFLQQIILIGGLLVAAGIFIAWIMSRNITRPLNRLTAAASVIASGNYSPSVIVDRRDEVGKLARAFNAMVAQVQQARQELEQKVIEAEQTNEQLRDLSAHLQNIREEERMHIAREMHDELGQLLTGFKMDVSWLNKKLADTNDPALREKLSEMITIVDESVMFVRKLAAELRPSILDDLGLIPALEWHSKEFTKRFKIEVEFKSLIKELQTSQLVATGLFRMYQESLTNVARHSGATRVKATLHLANGSIHLSITDNGKGFDMAAYTQKKTLGLLGMKERAIMIGGKLNIQSEPGKGTTITIAVPVTTPILV
jgi:signal transduction histidine kinase